jgi:hypothetical protein
MEMTMFTVHTRTLVRVLLRFLLPLPWAVNVVAEQKWHTALPANTSSVRV